MRAIVIAQVSPWLTSEYIIDTNIHAVIDEEEEKDENDNNDEDDDENDHCEEFVVDTDIIGTDPFSSTILFCFTRAWL